MQDRRIDKREARRCIFSRSFGNWDRNTLPSSVRDILGRLLESFADGFDEGEKRLRRDLGSGALGGHYNLFPSTYRGPLYPDFIGIAMGEKKLRVVLREACRHEEDWMKNGASNTNYYGTPTITILTDKWNRETFLEFEGDFLYYSQYDHCQINIILITDYSISTVFSI